MKKTNQECRRSVNMTAADFNSTAALSNEYSSLSSAADAVSNSCMPGGGGLTFPLRLRFAFYSVSRKSDFLSISLSAA